VAPSLPWSWLGDPVSLPSLPAYVSPDCPRVIGAVDETRLNILREADRILIEELHLAGVYR
jgi:hypothetical protein